MVPVPGGHWEPDCLVFQLSSLGPSLYLKTPVFIQTTCPQPLRMSTWSETSPPICPTGVCGYTKTFCHPPCDSLCWEAAPGRPSVSPAIRTLVAHNKFSALYRYQECEQVPDSLSPRPSPPLSPLLRNQETILLVFCTFLCCYLSCPLCSC